MNDHSDPTGPAPYPSTHQQYGTWHQPASYYPPVPTYYVPLRPGSGKSVASMVLGIIGLVAIVVGPVTFGVVPLLLGALALGLGMDARSDGERGAATAGLVMGIIAVTFAVIIGVIMLVGLAIITS